MKRIKTNSGRKLYDGTVNTLKLSKALTKEGQRAVAEEL
jgi:hypothetical protein